MKFLSIRELRNRPGELREQLDREDLVLTSHGKPIAVIIGVAAGDAQQTLEALRLSRALLAVSRLRQQAAEAGVDRMGSTEVEREIQAVRRARDQR